MKTQEWVNLSAIAGVCLLAYLSYLLANQPHYQISGGADVVWKLDTKTGALERCYPKADSLPTGQTYIEVVCDPDN